MSEIGYFALLLAFVMAAYSALASILGARIAHAPLIQSGANAALAVFVFLGVASAALLYSLAVSDFRLEYVASYTERSLPLFYKLSAFWAGQKGSLLLWAFVLSFFGAVVQWQHRRRTPDLLPYVLGVIMVVDAFFLTLMIFIANPFELLPPEVVPADGRGLNPLLQNPGMVFHPPSLYLGFIGLTIPFAFAMAALATRRVDDTWIRLTRSWTLVAWLFLSLGNLLGARWAYVELGWGGYWAWDPVENAAIMPWFTGTALLHSVMIQEKKDMLKVWNMVLVILTFLLTIFGTFLTRSGVITSVHTFTQSGIGPFFVGFLILASVASFGLLFHRLGDLRGASRIDSFLSRESAFLFNNLLLVGAAFAVFWGTIFPILSEAVRGVKITVGPPFFNQVMVPLGVFLLFLIGVGPLIAWRKATPRNLRRNFLSPFLIGLAGGALLWVLGVRHAWALLSFTLTIFAGGTIIQEFVRGTQARRETMGRGTGPAFWSLLRRSRRRYGGYIIHLGVLLVFVGITGTAFNVESEAALREGESMSIKGYRLVFEDRHNYADDHKMVVAARLSVYQDGRKVAELRPEKNFFRNEEQPSTEVRILSNFREDLYVILAGYDEERATFKVFVNPLVRWVWVGGVVLLFGTLITLWPEPGRKE